jgi:hypothetical protein
MTYLLEEHTGAALRLVPGGMDGLETYDALSRERDARAKAEATAAELAELIAAEHVHVAEARREAAELRIALDEARARADAAERELGKLIVNDYSQVAPPSLWERLRHRHRYRR